MNNVEGVVPTGITEVDYPTAANYFAMGYTSMFLTGPNALGDAYAAVFSNEKTNDQAVEQLVKDLDQLLEDYN